MGQGKSTLLKSLSGLTDNEIPALEGGACTAVRSTIENQPGETIAEVTLHSEDSCLKEVIYPYYEALGLTDQLITLEDFANKQFPPIQSGATNEQMYRHLRDDYHPNLKHYQYLLQPGTPRTQRILKEEIPEYTTQKRSEHKLVSFKHLAVREVKIFCPFKTADVGKIALVDVPGLGDSKLGDEDLMLKTLGQEVDIVLFIRRLDKLRYQWKPEDTQLYDKASEALNNLPNRSFIILNECLKTDNKIACENMQKELGTMRVVSCEIADCSNSEAANKIFDLVLNYLVKDIEALDINFAALCQEKLILIQQEVKAELDKANNIFNKGIEDEEESIFYDLFDTFLYEITNSLTDLLDNRLVQKRNSQDDYLKKQIEEVFQMCRKDTGIPTLEQIKKRSNLEGSYLTAYSDYLHEIRTNLSKKFLYLDDGLKYSIEEIKSLVTDILVDKGHLGGLTEARGSEFLKVISEEIPENLSSLKKGFQILSEFQLSYRGLIQHRIRKHLDKLTPNLAVRLPH